MRGKYAITGGPGCGKTTVLNLLSAMGYQVVPETARMVLEEKPNLKGTELQETIMQLQSNLESKIKGDAAFLDRSLVDCEGYADYFGGSLEGTSYFSRLENAKYETIVFHLEPLPEHLYKNDTQRKETFAEAQQISQSLKNAYQRRGFTVVSIPFSTPQERAEQIVSIASKYFAQIQKAA